MSFSDLGLTPELLRAVADKGYTTPTPIQSQAIPAVLSGRDVLAGAQTGTGKTAAFVLPILQKLGTRSANRAPRSLVLTPTRELAAQVAESARTYGKHVGLRTVVVFGGVGINPQFDALRSGCDILVATPGRLLDLQEQGAADLSKVEVFVLDEADRMLDMGFIRDIKRIIKMLPPVRQNLMFSATYSDEIRELAGRFLRGPVQIEVSPRNATADRVEQTVYRVSKDHKRHLLAHLINDGNWHQVLVFTRTKHGANRLAQQLEGAGIRSAAIHGNKSQAARVRALADFKANKVIALVATEVAARGLDIKELPQVVNYELPNVPEDYVHRIGRTARAGGTGCAVSLVSPDEAPLMRDIERVLRRSIPVATVPQFPILTAPVRAESDTRAEGAPSQGDRPAAGRGVPRSGQHRAGGYRGGGGRGAPSRGGRPEQRGHGHGGAHRGSSSGNGHNGALAPHGNGGSGGEQRAAAPQGQPRGNGNGGGRGGPRQGLSRGPGGGGGRGGNRGGRPSQGRSGPSRMY